MIYAFVLVINVEVKILICFVFFFYKSAFIKNKNHIPTVYSMRNADRKSLLYLRYIFCCNIRSALPSVIKVEIKNFQFILFLHSYLVKNKKIY